jgi:phage terminase large subunit
MKTAPLFQKLRECNKKFVVVQGGGDAGKTVSILQYFAIDAIETKNTITTVTGLDGPNLTGGALRSFQTYVEKDPEISNWIKSYHETKKMYTFYTKSVIEFKAFGSEQDARGSERDNLFDNEANSRSYSLFWQLQRKTRRKVVIDYNPTCRFWAHEKLLPGEAQEKQFAGRVQFLRVDHRHNPFLTQEEHDAYENISDPDLFNVFARGLTGKVKGLIYGHFKKVDSMPADCERYIWGLDYGYTNDPTAIVRIGIRGRQRFIKLCAYEPGLSPATIKQILMRNGWDENDPIYSEHDVNMVFQLRQLGLPVFPARKGPGSIIAKISKVKEYECFYTADSVRNEKGENLLEEELKRYKWVMAQDQATGKEVMTNIPVEEYDHACDALGYAIYTDSFKYR